MSALDGFKSTCLISLPREIQSMGNIVYLEGENRCRVAEIDCMRMGKKGGHISDQQNHFYVSKKRKAIVEQLVGKLVGAEKEMRELKK